MNATQKSSAISRRDFARGAALAATAVVIPLAACSPATSTEGKPEVEAMYNAILRQHGNQFNDEQKKELHAQIDSTVQGLEKLRTYTLENWDEPATVLHLDPVVASPSIKGAR